MTNNIEINTDRLLLHSVRLDDAEAIFKYRSDAIINQYQGWIPKIINDVYDFIKNRISSTIDLFDTWYQFVIINKKNNELIGDVGKKGGVFKATQGLYDKFGEDRVIDTPLAESAIAGVGIGAAMYGMRPIAEMQFADFIMPAVNQIISEAARIRYRSNNDWSCPIVVRAPYGGGVHGALYHSQSVEAVFANQPGLKIVMPSTPYDVKGLLKAAIRDEDPVLFFEHKRAYRLIKGEVPDDDYVLPIGKADVKREGEDITVITYGL